jgi:hypothetical protein
MTGAASLYQLVEFRLVRWFPTDWWGNPIALGVSVIVIVIVSGLSRTWQLDIAMDDPTGEYPNPTLNPGVPAGTGE